MAEVVAVISFVSVIFSLTETGWRLVERMKDFQSEAHEAPKVFRHLKAQLPITLDSLKRTETIAKDGNVDPATQEALIPALDGCREQLQLLDIILDRYLPAKVDSTWEKRKRAWKSVFKDKETKKIVAELDRYIAILTFYNTFGITKVAHKLMPRCTRIPAGRDPSFIDRPEIFTEMKLNFQSNGLAALEGIGGVGKTQIAVEQCYRFRDEHPESQIFWAHAGTVTNFRQACKAIAEDLHLCSCDDSQTDVVQLVHRWLSNEQNEPWLFVIDNIDDIEVLKDPLPSHNSSMTLGQFLPRNAQGLVLITTRDKRVGERLGVRGKTIRVSAMTMEEARQLLRSYLPSAMEIEENELEELVSSLDYIPLAITQAAALITENSISIQDYLEMFRTSDEEMQQLLSESLCDHRRSYHESNSVIKSWRLSFDQIEKQCPRAAEILSLMVMFDRQGIPAMLLQRENESRLTFLKAMGTLQAFSLIVKEADKDRYGMHRLVQMSTQAWLEVQGRTAQWIKEALCVLETAFPGTGLYESWRTCEVLLPHARAALQHVSETDDVRKSHTILRSHVARYDFDQGRHVLALDQAQQAYRTAQKLLGSRDLLTLSIVNQVTVYLIGSGKEREAMKLAQQHCPIFEQVLGVKHHETLACNAHIAWLLRIQGRLLEAETAYQKTLAYHESALGSDHENTMRSLSGLAAVTTDQRRYEEAQELYEKVIKQKSRVLGADHPSTLSSKWGLGQCLRVQQKFEEAELWCRPLYTMGQRVLGAEHPRTLLNMSELASSLSAQGKFQEAEDLFRGAVGRMQKFLGTDQLQEDARWATLNLGKCLAQQCKYEEAEEMYQAAHRLGKDLIGIEHERTLWIAKTLALCRDAQDKRLWATPLKRLYQQPVCVVQDFTLALARQPNTLSTKSLAADSATASENPAVGQNIEDT